MDKQEGQLPVLVLIGILVLAGVAGGAYFLGKSGKSEPAKMVSQPQSTSLPAEVATKEGDASPAPNGAGETANWKTYTNSTYKYSVMYPAPLETYGRVSPVNGINIVEPGSIDTNNNFITEASLRFFADGLQPNEKLTDKLGCTNFQEVGQTKLGDYQATEYITNCMTNIKTVITKVRSTILGQSGDFVYSISLYPKPNGDFNSKIINETLFNQILSTFRFTQ